MGVTLMKKHVSRETKLPRELQALLSGKILDFKEDEELYGYGKAWEHFDDEYQEMEVQDQIIYRN